MATLREKVQKALEEAGVPVGILEKAGIAACTVIEDEVGLAGNGWFDDDKVMLEALEAE